MNFNLAGKVFGVIQVIDNAGPPARNSSNQTSTIWKCHCSRCDETIVLKASTLRRKPKTCGSPKCQEITIKAIHAARSARESERLRKSAEREKGRSKRRWEKWFASKKYRNIMFGRIKERFGCMNPTCHWSGPLPSRLIDFHHKDPGQKEFVVARIKTRNIRKLASEIRKCVSLCANCHRLAHLGLADLSEIETIKVDDMLRCLS
jgi:hypothetical protein